MATISKTRWASMHHPMDCDVLGYEIDDIVRGDVTGDGVPDVAVNVACHVATGHSPTQVEVYDGESTAGAPRLLGVVGSAQGDDHSIKSISISPGRVRVTGVGWSSNAPNCCADLTYTQTANYRGNQLIAGAAVIGSSGAEPESAFPAGPYYATLSEFRIAVAGSGDTSALTTPEAGDGAYYFFDNSHPYSGQIRFTYFTTAAARNAAYAAETQDALYGANWRIRGPAEDLFYNYRLYLGGEYRGGPVEGGD